MKEIEIDGNHFSSLDGFYDELEVKLTQGLNWKIGRNLDALNDLLRGGFGVFDYDEKILLTWINSKKSEKELGTEATLAYLKANLESCNPSMRTSVQAEIEMLEQGSAKTLFNLIVEVIEKHDHIVFSRA
ncbi:barstar family protein [Croceimicrobium sp.]|uniref:barstar family protein n=1 Tax=Croceimicrobium sp. TaxID=2828340 RepID=UPI003BAAD465